MTLYEKLEREHEAGWKEGYEEGLAEGRKQGFVEAGRIEGIVEGLCDFVRDGILTRDDAVRRAENDFGIKQEDFLKLYEDMMHNS